MLSETLSFFFLDKCKWEMLEKTMQNTRQKTYAHGNAAPNNLKSQRFLTIETIFKISKFINKNVVVKIMFFFSFCLLLITIHYLVNSDIEFTVNRAVKLILVTTCRPWHCFYCPLNRRVLIGLNSCSWLVLHIGEFSLLRSLKETRVNWERGIFYKQQIITLSHVKGIVFGL